MQRGKRWRPRGRADDAEVTCRRVCSCASGAVTRLRLAELMIGFGVGVSVKQSHEVKRADEDYFAEA